MLLFDQYYSTLTLTDQQWYGMAKQGSTELQLLHKFMFNDQYQCFLWRNIKKIHILNYVQKVHLGIMIMTRNTNGEMWHLDYNPGFHSIAGQIEHSNKLDH